MRRRGGWSEFDDPARDTLDLITIYLCDLDLPLQGAKNGFSPNVLSKSDLSHPDAVLHLNRDKVYFQFRNTGDEPLCFIIATMPPRRGYHEVVKARGRWEV